MFQPFISTYFSLSYRTNDEKGTGRERERAREAKSSRMEGEVLYFAYSGSSSALLAFHLEEAREEGRRRLNKRDEMEKKTKTRGKRKKQG